MSVVLEIDLLLEQVRAVVSEQLAGTLVTPASCQVLWWLQAEGPSPGALAGNAAAVGRARRCGAPAESSAAENATRETVERLPHPITGKTAAWALTELGDQQVVLIARRFVAFDRLIEAEFRSGLGFVMEQLTRIRTVLRTQELSKHGETVEMQLRARGELTPPPKWRAAPWDL